MLSIELPPLRARAGDIELLTGAFPAAVSASPARPPRISRVKPPRRSGAHDFPGNVRELENALRRAIALSSGGVITIDCLPPEIARRRVKAAAPGEPEHRLIADRPTMEELERRYLQLTLEETGWNRRRAAAVLDLDRRTIQRLDRPLSTAGRGRPRRRDLEGGRRSRGKALTRARAALRLSPSSVCCVCVLCRCTRTTGPVVARAAGVTGQALLLSGSSGPLPLTPGYILNPGDRIDTRGGGRVVIDLSDGSMVVVAPESAWCR